jgi:hypothetical protein
MYFSVVLCTVCVYMCTELLPPGGYPIAFKYIIYHVSYRIVSYHIASHRIASHRIASHRIASHISTGVYAETSEANEDFSPYL